MICCFLCALCVLCVRIIWWYGTGFKQNNQGWVWGGAGFFVGFVVQKLVMVGLKKILDLTDKISYYTEKEVLWN
jgi:hypothetical protein